jgi:pimeloyl-ACP methyl ester carboxylesterase
MVFTPELPALTDYRIDTSSEDVIGAAAHALAIQAHRTSVGVMGLSFAGGLSLLAAADPRWAPDIAFVVAVGAHDDLPRVAHFFFDDKIARPDGSTFEIAAHDYGAMVLVYGNIEKFFPAPDLPQAREAIKQWLWEDPVAARKAEEGMSPESKDKLEKLFTRKRDDLRPELLELVRQSEPAMQSVSPHGHLSGLRVPIFLLHGAGDTVIPASETLWLASDAPSGCVRDVLISPAVVHVELEGEPTKSDQWQLVDFMAQVLAEAEKETPRE